jgi:transcriptional regulator with XRE-family HTH domain
MSDILTPGDRVRAARRQLGWSQQSLADLAGLSRHTVAVVEGGYAASRDTRDKLAVALDTDHDSLFRPVR